MGPNLAHKNNTKIQTKLIWKKGPSCAGGEQMTWPKIASQQSLKITNKQKLYLVNSN